MADWARLLSECWGLNLSRGFESRPPRHELKRVQFGRVLVSALVPIEGRIFESRTKVCFATLPVTQKHPHREGVFVFSHL